MLTRVPSSTVVKVTSSVLAPGGSRSEPAWPQLTVSRRGRSTSRKAPPDRDAVDVERELATGPRVKNRVVAHPAHDQLGDRGDCS
jgi:hypothetical protein